jgi:hypothetical protein
MTFSFLQIRRISTTTVKLEISETDDQGLFNLKLKQGIRSISMLPRLLNFTNNYDALFLVVYLALVNNLVQFDELLIPCYLGAMLEQHSIGVNRPRNRRVRCSKVLLCDIVGHFENIAWYKALTKKQRGMFYPRKIQNYLDYARYQNKFSIDDLVTQRLIEKLGFRKQNRNMGPHFVDRETIEGFGKTFYVKIGSQNYMLY